MTPPKASSETDEGGTSEENCVWEVGVPYLADNVIEI